MNQERNLSGLDEVLVPYAVLHYHQTVLSADMIVRKGKEIRVNSESSDSLPIQMNPLLVSFHFFILSIL
jgi:hypothetical protein